MTMSSQLSASIGVGFSALRLNPLRSALSALGVIIGVGAMVSVLSISDGVEREVRSQVERDGRLQSIGVSPITEDVVDGQSIPRDGYPAFTAEDARALAAEIGRLGTVFMSVTGPALVSPSVSSGGGQRAALVSGTLANGGKAKGIVLESGRFFSDAEVDASAKVAVFSKALAEAVAGKGKASSLIGQSVAIQSVPFQVIGIWTPGSNQSSAAAKSMSGFVPVSAVLGAIAQGGRRRAPGFTLLASTIENLPPMQRRAEAWLANRYGDWRKQISIASYAEESSKVRDNMIIFKLLMGAITGISLVVGGIGDHERAAGFGDRENSRNRCEKGDGCKKSRLACAISGGVGCHLQCWQRSGDYARDRRC